MGKHNMLSYSKPYLRWAGGKSWLIKYIPKLFPQLNFMNYHEPFLGSGAVFFSIASDKLSYLSDINFNLIQTYKCLKENPKNIISILKSFKNEEEFYYKIRNTKFSDPFEISAQFIFLNQTSFNGLYRVNLKGLYNVPYGFRTKDFLNENILYQSSQKLQNAELLVGDFSMVKNNVKKGDLVFLDPPYTVSHNNNGFIKYNEKLFSIHDQYRLSELILDIRKTKAQYILTNAFHKDIKNIFDNGDRIIEINRASLIGGINAKRGQITEYIFTNIQGS
jgi:DNA adenine methylase